MASVTGIGALREPEPDGLFPLVHPAEEPARQSHVERRSKTRFSLNLPVRYRTLGRQAVTAEGRVVNICSGGVLVAHASPFPVGTRMELRIEWPSLLDGKIGLQLVAAGCVVRSEPAAFAVMFGRYQFKTAPSNGRAQAASPHRTPL